MSDGNHVVTVSNSRTWHWLYEVAGLFGFFGGVLWVLWGFLASYFYLIFHLYWHIFIYFLVNRAICRCSEFTIDAIFLLRGTSSSQPWKILIFISNWKIICWSNTIDSLKFFWICGFCFQNKSNAPSENNLTLLCSGSGDQVEWHLGQDDSALHGKHLPPSPRKRVPSSGWTDSLFILKEENNEKHLSVDNVRGPAVTEKAASASELDFQLASPEVSEDEKCKTERKETLSQISDDLLIPSLGRHSSTFVPWEKEGKEAKETSEDSGLLHEVVSLCHITSAFQQDLNISEENTSGNQT